MKAPAILWHDVFELTKPRIALLALIMAALGYFLGSVGPVSYSGLVWMLIGLALVGASAGALNQYLEADVDRQMNRTKARPVPSGRMRPNVALGFGLATGFIGILELMFTTNFLTAILGAVTLLFYLGIYTPSKQFSHTSTLIGAVPGALPPLMGWTASTGSFGAGGILLFAILFLWQVPHFLAIAWLYKEDYARANLPILTVVNEDGLSVSQHILTYSLALLPLSLAPAMLGVAGTFYFWAALALGVMFLFCGMFLALKRTDLWARRVFYASLIYLPLLGFALVWDRVP